MKWILWLLAPLKWLFFIAMYILLFVKKLLDFLTQLVTNVINSFYSLLGILAKISPKAMEMLISAAGNDKARMRQIHAIEVLGFIDDERARQAVIQGLRDSSVYEMTLHIIAKWDDERGNQLLIKTFRQHLAEDNMFAARDAAAVMASSRRPEFLPVLFEGLGADWSSWNRDDFHKAIISFGSDAIPLAIAALSDLEPICRQSAVVILSGLNSQAVEPLLETMHTGPVMARPLAAKALGSLGDHSALTSLVNSTKENDPELKAAVAEALGLLRDPLAVEALIQLTRDTSPSVRAAAAVALGTMGDTRAVESLVELLKDETFDVYVNAQKSLMMIGMPAITALEPYLRDSQEQKRRLVAETLVGLGNQGLGSVLELLNEDNWRLRLTAATALKASDGTSIVVQSLIAMLDDPNFHVRQAAAASLGQIRFWLPGWDLTILVALERMLRREREPARQAAAMALLMRNSREVVTVIHSSLTEAERNVRLAMVKALVVYFTRMIHHFPVWFGVVKNLYQMRVNDEADTIIADLVAISRDKDVTLRQFAIKALQAIYNQLKNKREKGEVDVFGAVPGLTKNTLGEPVAQEISTLNALSAISLEPPPRYADFCFYLDSSANARIPEGYSLQVGQWYKLEVAVRQQPSGIPSVELNRRPVRELAQKEEITIWVTAEGDGFAIEEPVSVLKLPPSGDSTHQAVFRVQPLNTSASEQDLASVRIRLYYAFNLLEVVVVQAEVVGKFDDPSHPQLQLEKPIFFHQERFEQAYLDFDHIQPRMMHIDITRPGQDYQFNFAFYNADADKVIFSAPVRLKGSDLEDDLLRLRNLWDEIAMNKIYSQQLQGNQEEFLTVMNKLATAGRNLWVKLFKFESQGALFQVRRWLEEHPLSRDGIIQISVDRKAVGFFFPWAILYDRPLPRQQYQLPDPQGFWGLRYRLEQRLPMTLPADDGLVEIQGPLKVDFMLWEQFRNAAQEQSYFQGLQNGNPGKIEVSIPPVTDAVECFERLSQCEAHILYFYTHGYTRQRLEDIGSRYRLELFTQRYEALDETSPARQTYRMLYESLKKGEFEPDRSWIELSYGRLYLDELYDAIESLPSQPFVFLNMCESAQVRPSLSDSFIHFFLDRGARAVLGTECPMTIEFAHPFAKAVLDGLLSGGTLGEVLQQARCSFMEQMNPLGLAYTLFGPASLRLVAPVLEVTPKASNSPL